MKMKRAAVPGTANIAQDVGRVVGVMVKRQKEGQWEEYAKQLEGPIKGDLDSGIGDPPFVYCTAEGCKRLVLSELPCCQSCGANWYCLFCAPTRMFHCTRCGYETCEQCIREGGRCIECE